MTGYHSERKIGYNHWLSCPIPRTLPLGMKIGLVGYQRSGKSTLFHWLTGQAPDPALAHSSQSAMAEVTEARVAKLCEIYKPKKITLAALQLIDTPGLSRDHEGTPQKLAMIREAGCLVVVVAAFDGADAGADLVRFEEDLLIADLDIVTGRVERLKEALKKPRPDRDEQAAELAALEPLLERLNAGQSLHDIEMTPDQRKATKSFQLFSEKPRFIVINLADDDTDGGRFAKFAPAGTPLVAVPLRLQMELEAMPADEQRAFCEEMGVSLADREAIIRQVMDASGQMLFFTAGEKEVRTWMIHKGGTAVEAAGGIHTDLARGFIRAATMSCDDLFRLGSEREVKAANLMRQEPKDYVIQDGDVITIRHN
jgi:ribosome-binding ATPase YchF (GTP1/OBG family)